MSKNGQVGFILTDFKHHNHYSYESAQKEKARLSAMHPEKDFRVMRVVHINGEDINDMEVRIKGKRTWAGKNIMGSRSAILSKIKSLVSKG